MEETITMSGKEQRRAWMMTKPLVGELTWLGGGADAVEPAPDVAPETCRSLAAAAGSAPVIPSGLSVMRRGQARTPFPWRAP